MHRKFFPLWGTHNTSVHLYFSGLPIDLQVVVLEPGITEDHVLLSKAGDSKEHPFGVGFVTEDYVYNFGDLACLVGGAIDVVHQYGARDALGGNTLHMDKIFINETARSSGVQKRLNGVHLTGVCGADFYWENDQRSAGIKGIDSELFR